MKTRRNNRVVEVECPQEIGNPADFDEAPLESEDSGTLNRSFVERLNLTLRQAISYLTRRTTCLARRVEQHRKQLMIVRCHYNFLRPHRALKFGTEMRTPAMEAGSAECRLAFREIFLRFISSLESYRFADLTMIRMISTPRFGWNLYT